MPWAFLCWPPPWPSSTSGLAPAAPAGDQSTPGTSPTTKCRSQTLSDVVSEVKRIGTEPLRLAEPWHDAPMALVPTAAGDADVDDLGVVMMHEHVFIRCEPLQLGWPGFGGWATETEVATAREHLRGLGQAGVGAILDMTIPGLGLRDPALVARAAEGTGVKVMFATGYYTYNQLPLPFGVRGPGKVLDGDDRLLESLFERDLTQGIGDTGVRAAVLKLVTDEPGMTGDVQRLANAVASVHGRTGAPICTHAHAPSKRGLDQQRVFAERGVDLGRVMIGHSNESTDFGYLEELIANGSYLGW